MIPEPNVIIDKIPYNIFNKLARKLDDRDKIIKILDIFEEPMPDQNYSGNDLLLCFRSKLYTVQQVGDILRFCEFYDALSVICYDQLEVRRHPNKYNNVITIKRNRPFSLEFDVWGIPLPSYTWYKNNIEIPDQNSSILIYESFDPNLGGTYFSIATHILDDKSQFSIKSEPVLVETQLERCVIVKKPPLEQCFREGDNILLKIEALGYPEPKYEWTHNNTVLQKNTGRQITMSKCSKKCEGTYRCRVFNAVNEIIVKTTIKIIDSDYLFPISKEKPTEKIAFLIANQNYKNLSELITPINDIGTLGPILDSKGFLVIHASDLTLSGMQNALEHFCNMIAEGSYAIFYFGGHGYEIGEKYLLPVDAPDAGSFGFRDSMSEDLILKNVLDKRPKMFAIFLDMCLKSPDRQENVKIYEEKKERIEYISGRNLIQGFSTTSNLASYEEMDAKNSLYNKSLTKYLKENLPIIKILAKINQDFENMNKKSTTFLQIPCLSFNVTQEFDLNIPKIGHPKSQELFNVLQGLCKNPGSSSGLGAREGP